MGHNLFGERFFSHRVPAWHPLGTILEEEMGAREALNLVGGYDVHLSPLQTQEGLRTDYAAVVREPTADDPTARVFGVVKKGYGLVNPKHLAHIWDQSIRQPVETLGALGHGETMFISTFLPTIDVKGDVVDNYLLVFNRMDGGGSLTIRVTPVRVVCQNTLILSAAVATEVYKIRHDAHAVERTASWLEHVYERAEEKVKVISQVFDLLSSTPVTADGKQQVITTAYPFPNPPSQAAPPEVVRERLEWWERQRGFVLRHRQAVHEMFEGDKGTGLDMPPARGTYWGLYNAVAEYETYRRSSSLEARARLALVGNRAKTQERAFTASVAACEAVA